MGRNAPLGNRVNLCFRVNSKTKDCLELCANHLGIEPNAALELALQGLFKEVRDSIKVVDYEFLEVGKNGT